MDSISDVGVSVFQIGEVCSDRSSLSTVADVLVGIGADFRIVVDGVLLYGESDFPIAELAVELREWSMNGFEAGVDFEFDSMSTPERGWVWLRRGSEGWRVGSVHQDTACLSVMSDDEARRMVSQFVVEVEERILSALGVDLFRIVGEGGSID